MQNHRITTELVTRSGHSVSCLLTSNTVRPGRRYRTRRGCWSCGCDTRAEVDRYRSEHAHPRRRRRAAWRWPVSGAAVTPPSHSICVSRFPSCTAAHQACSPYQSASRSPLHRPPGGGGRAGRTRLAGGAYTRGTNTVQRADRPAPTAATQPSAPAGRLRGHHPRTRSAVTTEPDRSARRRPAPPPEPPQRAGPLTRTRRSAPSCRCRRAWRPAP